MKKIPYLTISALLKYVNNMYSSNKSCVKIGELLAEPIIQKWNINVSHMKRLCT